MSQVMLFSGKFKMMKRGKTAKVKDKNKLKGFNGAG